jgi:hypothetical protein
MLFLWIIPLRIDSLVKVFTTFLEVVLEKCKEFINKVGVLVRGYLTRRHRARRERLRLCFKTLRALRLCVRKSFHRHLLPERAKASSALSSRFAGLVMRQLPHQGERYGRLERRLQPQAGV